MCVIATWEFQLTVILRLAAPAENTIYANLCYFWGPRFIACVIATWGFQLTVRLRLAAPGENTVYVNIC